jgi:uncharacterized damage-inducible protein DinB
MTTHTTDMTIAETLLPEFDLEMATTRRVIERVPSDKGQWKPHPKSFALGHLTQLVATMPGWLTRIIRDSEIDLAAGPGYSYQATESLLGLFDKLVPEARATIASTPDADFAKAWSLKHGSNVLFTQSRWEGVRSTINHLCHHRGQLTVYLRLIDVPVPSIYGPTADEKWGV